MTQHHWYVTMGTDTAHELSKLGVGGDGAQFAETVAKDAREMSRNSVSVSRKNGKLDGCGGN